MSKLKYTVMKYSMPEWCTGDCESLKEFDDAGDALTFAEKLNEKNQDEESVFYSVIVYRDT